MKNFNDVIAPKDRARLERSIKSVSSRLEVLWKRQCARRAMVLKLENERLNAISKQFNLLEFV